MGGCINPLVIFHDSLLTGSCFIISSNGRSDKRANRSLAAPTLRNCDVLSLSFPSAHFPLPSPGLICIDWVQIGWTSLSKWLISAQ